MERASIHTLSERTRIEAELGGSGMRIPFRSHIFCAAPFVSVLVLGSVIAGEDPTVKKRKTDHYGDPLPPGAIARLGTLRLRNQPWTKPPVFTSDGKSILTYGSFSPVVKHWDAASGAEIREFRGPNLTGVEIIAISRDGAKLVASASGEGDENLFIWDMRTAKLLKAFKSHEQYPKACALTEDDKTVVSLDSKGEVCWWDIKSGTCRERWNAFPLLRKPPGPGVELQEIETAFLRNNGRVLVVQAEWRKGEFESSTITVCDLKNKEQVWSIAGSGWLSGFDLSPNGKSLVYNFRETDAVKDPGDPIVVEIPSGKELHRFRQREDETPEGFTFSPDGATIAMHVRGRGVFLWDLNTNTAERRLKWPEMSHMTAYSSGQVFSPDGRRLLTVVKNVVSIWDLKTLKEALPWTGHRLSVSYLNFSSDGLTLQSGQGGDRSHPEELRTWDTRTWKETKVSYLEDEPARRGLATSSDHVDYVNKTPDGEMSIRDRATDRIKCTLEARYTKGYRTGGFFSPDGRIVCLAKFERPKDKDFWVLDATTGKLTGTIPNADSYWRFAVAPSNDAVAWHEEKSGTICVYGLPENKILWTRKPALEKWNPFGTEPTLVFSWDGKLLASWSGGDNDVHIWNVQSGKELRRIPGIKPDRVGGRRVCIAFSADSRILALGGMGGEDDIQIWELMTGQLRCKILGHTAIVQAVAFSRDGRLLASGGDDTTVLVWDLYGLDEKGNPRRQLLKADELVDLWIALGQQDAERAGEAVASMKAARLGAAEFLDGKLSPAPKTPDSVRDFVKDLESESFAVRDKASRELLKLGELAVTALRTALKDDRALEFRRRAEKLLHEIERGTPEHLRSMRSIEILEFIGGEAAIRTLERLAGGNSEERFTQEAQSALKRMGKRGWGLR